VDGQHLNPELSPVGSTTADSRGGSAVTSASHRFSLIVVVGSLLFVAAQPRLYRAFCEWTGLYDIDRAEQVAVSSLPGRPVTLEFDANSHDGGLLFRPQTNSLAVKTGEIVHVIYRVENTRDSTVIGQAVPSYGPQHAGGYVKKLECFCFKQQTFAPHEVREMDVVFLIDPKLPDDVATVTLSYTFFEVPVQVARRHWRRLRKSGLERCVGESTIAEERPVSYHSYRCLGAFGGAWAQTVRARCTTVVAVEAVDHSTGFHAGFCTYAGNCGNLQQSSLMDT
jgi:cytochrome c oxidase assembly protein subunit 11